MSSSSSSSGSGGVSALGLLGVLFVGLKLTGHITWPWIWVTAPFWGPLALLLAILVAVGVIWLAIVALDAIIKK